MAEAIPLRTLNWNIKVSLHQLSMHHCHNLDEERKAPDTSEFCVTIHFRFQMSPDPVSSPWQYYMQMLVVWFKTIIGSNISNGNQFRKFNNETCFSEASILKKKVQATYLAHGPCLTGLPLPLPVFTAPHSSWPLPPSEHYGRHLVMWQSANRVLVSAPSGFQISNDS